MKRMKIPGWGQCASVRGGHGDVPAHSSPSRARWLGMRMLVLTVLLSMIGAHGAWAEKYTFNAASYSKNDLSNVVKSGFTTDDGLNFTFVSGKDANDATKKVSADDSREENNVAITCLKFQNPSSVRITAPDGYILDKIRIVKGGASNSYDRTFSCTYGSVSDGVVSWTKGSQRPTEVQLTNDGDGNFYAKEIVVEYHHAALFNLTAHTTRDVYWNQWTWDYANNEKLTSFGVKHGDVAVTAATDKLYITATNNGLEFTDEDGTGKSAFIAFRAKGRGYVAVEWSADMSIQKWIHIGDNNVWDKGGINEYHPVGVTQGTITRTYTDDADRVVYVGASSGMVIKKIHWVPEPQFNVIVPEGGVPVSGNVTVKATTRIDGTTVAAKLYKNGSSTAIDITGTVSDGSGNYQEWSNITFPVSGLDYNTEYYIVIPSATSKDSESSPAAVDAPVISKITVSNAETAVFKTEIDKTVLNTLPGRWKWTAGDFGPADTDNAYDSSVSGWTPKNKLSSQVFNGYIELFTNYNQGGTRYDRYVYIDEQAQLRFFKPATEQYLHFIIPKKGKIYVTCQRGWVTTTSTPNVRIYDKDGGDLGHNGNTNTGELKVTGTYSGNDTDVDVYIKLDGGQERVAFTEILYIPDPEDLIAIETPKFVDNEWGAGTFANGDYAEDTNNGTDHIRILADASHTITAGAGGFTINATSSATKGFIMFPAPCEGTVKVYAQGTGSGELKTIIRNGDQVDVGFNSTHTDIDKSAFAGISASDPDLAAGKWKVRVELDEVTNEGNFNVHLVDNWSNNFATDKNFTVLGNLGSGKYADFTIDAAMLERINSTGGLWVWGWSYKFTRVYLVHEGAATESQVTISAIASGAIPMEWEDVEAGDESLHTRTFFNVTPGRMVYIGATAGTVIKKIVWTPGKAAAGSQYLKPVTTTTTWDKYNNYGGYAYPATGLAITEPIMNPGNKRTKVAANTLLIYGASGRTEFTNSSSLNLKNSLATSGYVEFKVKGPGVVKIKAAGQGPSGRWAYVSTNYSDKDNSRLTVLPDGVKAGANGVEEHDLEFRLHQYSSYHTSYFHYKGGESDNEAEGTSLYVWTTGCNLEDITWIPESEAVAMYGEAGFPSLCPQECLAINEENVTLNPYNYDSKDYTSKTTGYTTRYTKDMTGVTADFKTPVWTTSQDGRYDKVNNNVYVNESNFNPATFVQSNDHIVKKIHDTRAENVTIETFAWHKRENGTTTDEIRTKSYANGWNYDGSGNKVEGTYVRPWYGYGIVYVVAGTNEGNRTDFRRVEVAGPASNVDLKLDNASSKEIVNGGHIVLENGSSRTVIANPWLTATDLNIDKAVRIKVDDPAVMWTQSVSGVVELSAESADPANDLASIVITAANAGTTVLTAKTRTGKVARLTIEVPDDNVIVLKRKNPTDDQLGCVSVTEVIRFEAWGTNITENTVLTIYDTDLDNTLPEYPSVHSNNTITATPKRYGDHWIYEFDIPADIKTLTNGGMDRMNYQSHHTFEFITTPSKKLKKDQTDGFIGLQKDDNSNEVIYNFSYITEPNPADVRTETFIYNVAQRTDAQINADLTAGELLSENKHTETSGAASNVIDGNGASHISLDNSKLQNNGGATIGSKAATEIRVYPIDPDDRNKEGIEHVIESIEINCDPSTVDGSTITIYIPELDANGNVVQDGKKTSVKPCTIDLDNNYTAVWKPTSYTRDAIIALGNAGINISQIKINYYVIGKKEKPMVYTFAYSTSGGNGFKADLKNGILFKDASNNDKVKLTFRQKDKRFFNLVEHWERSAGYNGDNDATTIGDTYRGTRQCYVPQLNTMAVRDDKIAPCEMWFETTDNNSLITSIEFVYEVDEGNNKSARNMFCISDPRYNTNDDQKTMTGYPLKDMDLVRGVRAEGDNTTPEGDFNDYALVYDYNSNKPYDSDKMTLKKLVYQPESPTNFAAIALDAEQEGYVFVRAIIVRYNNSDNAAAAYKLNTSSWGNGHDVTNAPVKQGMLNIDIPADNATCENVFGFIIKRTSLRNNLSNDVVLTSGGDGFSAQTGTNTLKAKASGASLRHQKYYTVRLLNEKRMVVRQLAFHVESIPMPIIAYNGEPNNDREANTIIEANNANVAMTEDITITAPADDVHSASSKVIVYTTNGDVPTITFSDTDPMKVESFNGAKLGLGTGVIIDNNELRDMLAADDNTVVIKAIVLPVKNALSQVASEGDVNDAGGGTYGECSELTRAYYVFADNNTYVTSATRTIDADGEAHYSSTVNDDEYDIRSGDYEGGIDDKFHAGYTPTNENGPDMLTYGGYEIWRDDEKNGQGGFKHTTVKNDIWMVAGNDLTPWRGARDAIARDAYIVSQIAPLTEAAKSGYDANTKLITFDTNAELANHSSALFGYKGEFDHKAHNMTLTSQPWAGTWNLPCYGGYFVYEPEADGTLTVFVKQQGVLNQAMDASLDDMQVWNRAVYIYDEAGHTPEGITAQTTSRVGGDWMTSNHTAIHGNRYLTKKQSENLIDMCLQWIKDNTAENEDNTAENDVVNFGDRATIPQGVITLHRNPSKGSESVQNGPINDNGVKTTYTYKYDTEKLATVNGDDYYYEDNGFLIVTTGYVKYELPVKAGKSYFMFQSRGQLGLCSYNFQPSAISNSQDSYELKPGLDDADIVKELADMTKNGQTTKVGSFRVKRKITPNTWTSLVLPFSVSKKQLRSVFGDGVEVIHFDGMFKTSKNNVLNVHKHVHQMVVAGVPVFIRPTRGYAGANADDYPTFHNVTVETSTVQPITINPDPTDESRKDIVTYICKGSYGWAEGDEGVTYGSWYLTNTGEFSRTTKQNPLGINGTRAWIVPAVTPTTLAPTVVGFYRGIEDDIDEAEATSIRIVPDNAALDNDIDEASPATLNNVYDASGRIVRAGTTDLRGLPAGIYIVNGEKHVIK